MEEKNKYTYFENIKYMLKNWFAWEKKSLWLVALRVPALVVLPMLTALIPKLMIDYINEQASVGEMVGMIAAMSALVAGLTWLDPYLNEKIRGVAEIVRTHYTLMTFEKTMATDFVNVESTEGREKLARCKQFLNWQTRAFMDSTIQFVISLVGIFSYLAVLSRLHPGMLLLIAATCLGEFFLFKVLLKANISKHDDQGSLWMRFDYFYKVSHEFAAGKDIRIYSMSDRIIKFVADAVVAYEKTISKFTRQNVKTSFVRGLLAMARDAVAYIYLIVCVLNDTITVSDFIFYFGLITGFAGWILGIVNQVHTIENCAIECGKFRDYIEMPDSQQRTATQAVSYDEQYSIEFKDVDFQYYGSDELTLKGMNFKVNKGENIAIVGKNGAGKTTAIKILCGLYEPTNGQMLVNGVPVQEYGKEEFYSLFSAVYQDFVFLPMSVEKNVCLCSEEKIDYARLEDCLKKAGIYERIERLPKKGKTMMIKEVYKNAVQFSGGEMQKLLLARALYRDAPILVLDEPTAALDPIAENELYEKYNNLTKGKTSFFISHRLSSTRFCDRILFIDDGMVSEQGTHNELMEQRGSYFQMYQLQSYYYREEQEDLK